jgi:hypothetical protein
MGHLQTFWARNGMSASPLKADVEATFSDVCFAPISGHFVA